MKGHVLSSRLVRLVVLLSVTILLTGVLSACHGGEAAQTPKKKDTVSEETLMPVLAEADGSTQSLNGIGVKAVTVREKNIDGQSSRQEQWKESTILYGTEGAAKKARTKMPVADTVQERLDIDGQSYLRNEGRCTWVMTTSDSPTIDIDYRAVYEEFKNIAPKLSLEETQTDYIFTFEGEDADLYRTLRERYKLHIEGAPDEAVHLKLKYVVAKETHTLKEIHHTSQISAGSDNVHLQATLRYTAVDPTADIQPPAPENIIQP